MKTLLTSLCLMLFLPFTAQQNLHDYHLSWDGQSSLLKVKLNYTANNDSTVFEYGEPDFGGQLDIFKVLKNVKSPKGEKININEKDRSITVYHQGKGSKTITYQIDGGQPADKKPSIYTELFRPVIMKGFFTFVTNFFMLETSEENPLISVVWDEYPKKMAYFNSIDPKAPPHQKMTLEKNKLGRRFFAMGNTLKVTPYKVGEIDYYSIYADEEAYKDLNTATPPFFISFFPSIRKFWNDYDAPFYFVAVLPIQYGGKTGAGGFGMDNGFLMKYRGDFTSWEKAVVAHETSHTWIGQKMIIGNKNFDHQWFGEGFNDYVTQINLVNSGIFSKEDFLNYLNDNNFQKHYTSPVKDASNAAIADKYWTDYKNYGKLPYRRGLIYAFYLDNQIRLASGGKHTLRDFMQDLFALYRSRKDAENHSLTLDEFIEKGAQYIPREQLQHEVDTYLIKGTPIDFKTVKLIPEFELYFNGEIPQVKLAEGADLSKIYNW